MKKTVIKVNINCQICKKGVLKAATELTGIDSVALDGEKGTLTIVGDVDPVVVVKRLRKTGKTAQIISVGPPKPEQPNKPADRTDPIITLSPCCKQCELVAFGYAPYDAGMCLIL